jgi:hypothetical protein
MGSSCRQNPADAGGRHIEEEPAVGASASTAEHDEGAVDFDGARDRPKRELADALADRSPHDLRRVFEERSVRSELLARGPCSRACYEAPAVVDEHDSLEAAEASSVRELVMQRGDRVAAAPHAAVS